MSPTLTICLTNCKPSLQSGGQLTHHPPENCGNAQSPGTCRDSVFIRFSNSGDETVRQNFFGRTASFAAFATRNFTTVFAGI
jgi:hypothetical protein